jgi:hypothetical protein
MATPGARRCSIRRSLTRSPAGASGSSQNACSTPAVSSFVAVGRRSRQWIRTSASAAYWRFRAAITPRAWRLPPLGTARRRSSSCHRMRRRMKIDNTRALGAEVVLYDRATEDRDAIGDRLAAERGLTLIKPYDEPLVIAGQGTCGLEIAEQASENGISQARRSGLLRRRRLRLRHRAGAGSRRPRPQGASGRARGL